MDIEQARIQEENQRSRKDSAYGMEMQVLKLCYSMIKDSNSSIYPVSEAKIVLKKYMPVSDLKKSDFKIFCAWISASVRGLDFQSNANFACVIASRFKTAGLKDIEKEQNEKDRDRTISILSNDRTHVLATIKAKSVGLLFTKETSSDVEFVWSDHTNTGEEGNALSIVNSKISNNDHFPRENVEFLPRGNDQFSLFLKPKISLRNEKHVNIPIGIFVTAFGFRHVFDIIVSENVHQFLVFNDDDIDWNVKVFGDITSDSSLDGLVRQGENIESMQSLTCNFCHASWNSCNDGLKLCSGCRKVRYCNVDCQTKDRKKHKRNCLPIKKDLRYWYT